MQGKGRPVYDISISESILICLVRFFFLRFDLRFEALTDEIQILKKTVLRFKTEIQFESCPSLVDSGVAKATGNSRFETVKFPLPHIDRNFR